jgi:hypothetical protein
MVSAVLPFACLVLAGYDVSFSPFPVLFVEFFCNNVFQIGIEPILIGAGGGRLFMLC